MSTKNTNQKPKNNRLPLYFVTVAIVLGALTSTVFSLNKPDENNLGSISSEKIVQEYDKREQREAQIVNEGESLTIPISEQSSTVNFYPVEVDGVSMEVLAVKDSDGYVRTAFNTCQVCYSSGRGYYEQQGELLICQNCGNAFTISQVEVKSGGCNPWPIFEKDKTVTDETIAVSYDFLKESSNIFANWKTLY